MTDTVRIVVCGDEGTGKSSLITCLVKDHFRPTKIQPTLPPLTIGAPEGVLTTIVDTSGKCGRGGGATGGADEGKRCRRNGIVLGKRFGEVMSSAWYTRIITFVSIPGPASGSSG
jgi:GTPase SAR1 family protein